MQTTLAGNAAAREEAREKRASQEGRPASADDAYPSGKGKRLSGAVAAPVDVNATYHDGDDADAYFEENGQLVVQVDGAGELMMPFSGFYDDVSYPVTTLFFPPQAPGDMPPRVQPPPRPGPQYLNDLALAGDVENDAQTMVSKIWRGIMTRRNLHNSRTHEHIVNSRARMAQCWWRCVVSKRRASQLRTLKGQWVEERAASYLAEKKKGLANMMTWQRSRFEGAAIKLQRTVRWYLRRCQRQRCADEGVPEDQWPEELPFPVPHKVTRYFWWRRTTAEKAALAAAEAAAMGLEAPEGALVENANGEEGPRRTTILEFKKEREPVPPPPQSEVEKTNADMRRRTRSRALSLAQPEAQSRREWKQEGLKREDLDFNAGVIQRLYRSKRSESKVRTVELTKTYMDNVVRIISRTFRMYLLVQRLKSARFSTQRRVEEKLKNYSKAKIADVEHKMVWGKDLLDAAARTIQQCWHWYRHTRFGILPLRIQKQLDHRKALEDKKQKIIEDRRTERRETIRKLQEELGVDALPEGANAAADNDNVDETVEGDEFAELEESFEVVNPTKPPYHLIDDYLAREEELRDAMMTLLDRNAKEMASRRTYVKFTPKNVINRNGRYTFIAKEKS